jgi:3-hydroxymyristoyl/3-hydroxydecanoyl-(acyl carrier protein) dehydratase
MLLLCFVYEFENQLIEVVVLVERPGGAGSFPERPVFPGNFIVYCRF